MSLAELRKRIDEIDSKLLALLNQRADCVHEVGQLKKRDGLAIYAPEREEQLLQALVKRSKGRLPEKSIRAIYREIMSASLALEKHLVIAYPGPEATWSHQAARRKFGESVDYAAQAGIAEVFDRVSHGQADYGVVAIETAGGGAVAETLAAFVETELKVCAQFSLQTEVQTRFVVIGHSTCPQSGRDRTLVMLGGAVKAAALLKERGLAAREVGRQGEQFRFFELGGHAEEAALVAIFKEMEKQGGTVKVLGSYPEMSGG